MPTDPDESVGRHPIDLRPLPSTSARATRTGFAIYRIAIRLSKNDLGYFVTHGRPELRGELINRMEVDGDALLIEARVFGPGAADLVPLIRQFPHLVSVEVLRESEQSALYRAKIKQPALQVVLRRHRILVRYPVVYVDGWARFETLAIASQVRAFVKDLEREVGPSRVEAVRQGSVMPSVLGLTSSQLVVFRAALAAGYFASPRRISLSNLARQLGRSKSTISQQVAMIQRRLAESALRLKWDTLPA